MYECEVCNYLTSAPHLAEDHTDIHPGHRMDLV